MVTDTERREVARRMRMLAAREHLSIPVLATTIECECSDDAHLWNRLADLIEPPLQCPHYHSDRHYCSVHEDVQLIDRDALLALANEMEYDADAENAAKCDPMLGSIARMQVKYANRIRKALGVES